LLHSKAAREANLASANYSASRLGQNKQGIPNQLIGGANWTMTGADLEDSTTQVKIRYVIDRLCTSAGAFDASTCSYLQTPADSNGTNQNPKPIGPRLAIYRVTVRVTDSVGTQSYFQSTFSY
jgi:type IV pilus assembly protein PilX